MPIFLPRNCSENSLSHTELGGRNLNPMGVDIYLYLFNRQIFTTRIAPAYKQFVDKDDSKPIIALLREAIQLTLQNNRADPRLSKVT